MIWRAAKRGTPRTNLYSCQASPSPEPKSLTEAPSSESNRKAMLDSASQDTSIAKTTEMQRRESLRHAISIGQAIAAPLLAVALTYSLADVVMRLFKLSAHNISAEPPWYFIEHDFAEGIAALAALLLVWLWTAIIWRFLKTDYVWMTVWMSWIWLADKAVKSWIIYHTCPGLLGGGARSCDWISLEKYLHDERFSTAESAMQWSVIPLVLSYHLVHWWRSRKTKGVVK